MEKGSEKKKHSYSCLVHKKKKGTDSPDWDWEQVNRFQDLFRAAMAAPRVEPAREEPVAWFVRENP